MSFSSRIRRNGALFGMILATAGCVPALNATVDADVEAGWEAYHRQDDEKALALFKKAAARGVSSAYAGLGQLYFDGNAVEMNMAEARKLFEKGAAANDPEAMMRLADMLRLDADGQPAGRKRARELLNRVVAAGGDDDRVSRAREWLAEIAKVLPAETPAAVAQTSMPGAPVAKPVEPKPPASTVSAQDMGWAVRLEERKKNGYRPSAAEDARYKAILAALSKPAQKPGQAEYDQATAAANAGQADRAFMLLMLAAQSGHVQAMMELSSIFIQSGKPEGMQSGLFWLSKAAEAGEPDAIRRMALLKKFQAGAEETEQGRKAFEAKNYTEAAALFKKAVEAGNPGAPRILGQLYEQGLGVEKNAVEARRLYAEGVAREDADSFLNLAEVTRAGVGGPRDLAEAGRIYERLKQSFASLPKAVEQADKGIAFLRGDTAQSALVLGSEAYQHKQMEEARRWMEKSANLGSAQGMFNTGVFYRDGTGGPRDLGKAIGWFEKAAAGGWKNADKEARLLRSIAASEDALASADAAQLAKRYREARGFYEKAAAAGNVEAMRKLGDIYRKGIAVIKDDDAALRWFERAAAAGDTSSEVTVESMRSNKQWRDAAMVQNRTRAAINGTTSTAQATVKTGPAVAFDSLIKNTPWTTAQIASAIKSGADHEALAVALRTDGAEEFYDGDYRLLLAMPEAAGIDSRGNLGGALEEKKLAGAGKWARELAGAAIAARKAQLKLPPPVADSAELRAKAKAGDPITLYELAFMPESARTFGGLTKEFERSYADWAKLMRRANHAPGFWLIGDDFAFGSDDTKKDPLAAVDYYRQSAQAGSARGAEKLAGVFNNPGDKAVAPNFFEVEAWLIEAAARARPGEFPILPPEQRLYLLYSGTNPSGYGSAMRLDEEDLRWLRELQRRGGPSRELATAYLAAFKRKEGDRVDLIMAEIPPEAPAFSAKETASLEKAAAGGDVSAMVKLADALATGRGLRQHDKRAVDYYRQAAGKGSVHAMSRLAGHYQNGHGVTRDPVQRTEWLRKASEAGGPQEAFDYGSALVSAGGKNQAAVIVAAYEKAVAGGVEHAANQLADVYLYGAAGVEKNRDKALAVLLKEFEKGRTQHAARIGLIYAGNNEDANALVWLQKAWSAGQRTVGQEFAKVLIRNQRRAEGLAIYKQLSEQGNDTVQYLYAAYLAEDGKLAEAYAWNKRVAENPSALMRADAAKKVAEYEAKSKP